jgi:hypothetical protein
MVHVRLRLRVGTDGLLYTSQRSANTFANYHTSACGVRKCIQCRDHSLKQCIEECTQRQLTGTKEAVAKVAVVL